MVKGNRDGGMIVETNTGRYIVTCEYSRDGAEKRFEAVYRRSSQEKIVSIRRNK